jgi:nitrogen fixation NifU-like protein
MTESVKGHTVGEADALFDGFHRLVTSEAPPEAPLGKLEVFAGVSEFPMRVKCATLAWHTLKAALHSPGALATTE